MIKIAISAAKIFAENNIACHKYLLVENNLFKGIYTKDNLPKDDVIIKEYPDLYILPGLIDTHIHGAVGYDTMDATPEAINKISDFLLTKGTTSWMPTTVTAPLEDIYNAIANVAKCQNKVSGSRILGLFIESCYITSEHRGAHPEKYIRKLAKDEILAMKNAGPVKAIIIAPEKEHAVKFTTWITQDLAINVSLGHSSATYEEACACFDVGADASVHTFCGMGQFHHRSPNLLGAAMTRDDIYTELIADGIHVSVPAMKLLTKCKPKDKLILITDAIRGAGLKDGRYMLGTLPFNVKNGVARLDSGNIAGGSSVLIDDVKRLIREVNVAPIDAINAASLNPAKRFKLDDKLGSIAPGKLADFILVNKDYEVQQTWLNGKCVFVKEKACI